jgi:hypothetical protein
MASGTDANWASSRTKAVLHHRFRDTDGTWKVNLIKNNSNNVNSYCRTKLAFDAFDNAYVLANGAEVYVATPENAYMDWTLMSDIDKGRFCSEPQIDAPRLLSDGVLSFVYLGRDKKVTVIDYLTDNPHVSDGQGLFVEYFSDAQFENKIGSGTNASIGVAGMPAGTKSSRWSGTLETLYGEEYTLYLNTSAASKIYLDGTLLSETGAVSGIKEFSVKVPSIGSHKHTIVLELATTSSSTVSLSWSSASTPKTEIPSVSLYAEKQYQNDNDNSYIYSPDIKGMAQLPVTLLNEEKNIIETAGKNIFRLPFNPSGNYTLEVTAQVLSAEGRGLDIEARSNTGKGFRVSLTPTELNWTSPFSNATSLPAAPEQTSKQILRFAVESDNVHIYRDNQFLLTKKTVSVGDINDSNNEVFENLYPNPEFKTGTLNCPPAGWVSGTAFQPAGNCTASGVRVFEDLTRYADRMFFVRFDPPFQTAYFAYPITLEADTHYEYSFDIFNWNNGAGSKPVKLKISSSPDGTVGVLKDTVVWTGNSDFAAEHRTVSFRTGSAGIYYLTYAAAGYFNRFPITRLSLFAGKPSLLLGKNYMGGLASFSVFSVKYADDAYTPDVATSISKTITNGLQAYAIDGVLYIDDSENVRKISLYDISGRLIVRKTHTGGLFEQNLERGIYLLHAETPVGIKISKIFIR